MDLFIASSRFPEARSKSRRPRPKMSHGALHRRPEPRTYTRCVCVIRETDKQASQTPSPEWTAESSHALISQSRLTLLPSRAKKGYRPPSFFFPRGISASCKARLTDRSIVFRQSSLLRPSRSNRCKLLCRNIAESQIFLSAFVARHTSELRDPDRENT